MQDPISQPAGEAASPEALREIVQALLAFGPRSTENPASLHDALAWLEGCFIEMGYRPLRQTYLAGGVECSNLEVSPREDLRGVPHIVIGAHYDSVPGSPGADDNASAIAILLALARMMRFSSCPLRFVAFVNEEFPYHQTELMGSAVFARRCRESNDEIVCMICLDSLGIFSQDEGSQDFPEGVAIEAPDGILLTKGNFVAGIANDLSASLLPTFQKAFSDSTDAPFLPAVLPGMVRSDHWEFWNLGYKAIFLTDTAPFRNRHYHQATDTAEKLDYSVMAELVTTLQRVVEDLLKQNDCSDQHILLSGS